jgi:putative membrane protein
MDRRARFRAVALVCALALLPALAAAASPKRKAVQPARTVDQFVARAAGRSLAGVELSDLALQRSESASVRRLARRAHDEHARTYDTLLGVATGAGISAAPPATIDLEQRGIKARLSGLQGAAFDRAYVAALRTNDARDIALYRSFAQATKDDSLKAWIDEQLTTIRRRQQLIETTARDIS